MQPPSLLTKALTLTLFFALLTGFVAYRVGAFDHLTAGRPAQDLALASSNPIDTPATDAETEMMSSSKSAYIPRRVNASAHSDSASVKAHADSVARRHRLMMSSSKSMAVFPAENSPSSDSSRHKKKPNAQKAVPQQQQQMNQQTNP